MCPNYQFFAKLESQLHDGRDSDISEFGSPSLGSVPSSVLDWPKATVGLLWWFSGKEFTCQFRRHRFDSWVGKIPWIRK